MSECKVVSMGKAEEKEGEEGKKRAECKKACKEVIGKKKAWRKCRRREKIYKQRSKRPTLHLQCRQPWHTTVTV